MRISMKRLVRYLSIFAFVYFGAGGYTPLRAQQQAAYSLQDVLKVAATRNPTLLSAEQHLQATKASEATASLRQNPNFQLLGQGVTLPKVNNKGGNPYFYSASVSRLFERGNKRGIRMEIANDTTSVTASQLEDLKRSLNLAVKEAFTQMLLAKEALHLADSNLTEYRKEVELNRERLKAGDISPTDFQRIDLQLAGFESDYENAKLALTQSSDALQVLLGYDQPRSNFDISGSLTAPDVPETVDQLQQQALNARPDYLAAKQSVDLAKANVKMADADATTDPTLAAEYEKSGADNTFGASVNIPLRIFDRNQGERQRTRFEVQSSQLAEQAARNQVVSDVDQAWAGYTSALAQARRYNSHYLKESEDVRTNMEYSFRHGAATLLDYLDALREYRQTHLDALNANAQVWLAIHQLSYATATEVVQ